MAFNQLSYSKNEFSTKSFLLKFEKKTTENLIRL